MNRTVIKGGSGVITFDNEKNDFIYKMFEQEIFTISSFKKSCIKDKSAYFVFLVL